MRLVLFDCDGTLVDSAALIVAAAEDGFRELGLLPPPAVTIRAAVGLSVREAVQFWEPPLDASGKERLAKAFGRHYWLHRASGRHQEPLFPGIGALLEALAAEEHRLLGVVTGNSRRGLDEILAHHRLAELFHTLQTADRHPSKPHPAMVLQALAETGAEAAETVVIGDTAFDIEMARAAGAKAIGVAWGNHPAERLHAAGADHVVHSAAELRPLLGLP